MLSPNQILSSCPLDLSRNERIWLAGYEAGKVDAGRGIDARVPTDSLLWANGYEIGQLANSR
jgi:hypothetical protein